jgi:two-component system C4-dicarboxylate transport response regulator DctD
VVTGHGSIDSAVRCMRRGAFDYLEKPFRDSGRIGQTVRAALERRARILCAEATHVALSVDHRARNDSSRAEASVPLSLEAYEGLALERALQESGGDARLAAARLGIGRSTFYRKAAKLGIALRRLEDDEEADTRTGSGVGRAPSIS